MNEIVPAGQAMPWEPKHNSEATPASQRHGPGFVASSLLALRLAWRQLISEKARLASAIAGVLFA